MTYTAEVNGCGAGVNVCITGPVSTLGQSKAWFYVAEEDVKEFCGMLKSLVSLLEAKE